MLVVIFICAFVFELLFVLLLLAVFGSVADFNNFPTELMRKYFHYLPTNFQEFLSEINF